MLDTRYVLPHRTLTSDVSMLDRLSCTVYGTHWLNRKVKCLDAQKRVTCRMYNAKQCAMNGRAQELFPRLLNRWAAPVLWEALDEKVTPFLVEDAVESVKLRGAKLELKATGQVEWLFLSALRTVYRKTLKQDAEIRKLRDEVAALQERQLLIKETIESAVTRGDQMEARCTALAVRVAKEKSRQKPKMPSTVQVRALVHKQKSRQKPKIPSNVQVRALLRKENWDP
ncbi:hypothetical protein NDU88_002767 [Pleurodeles waltl]|uniref:Uncharacterized protein n=1 Tax=Pleurodeles waltl TaxID=8319 RepID=A0AAV7VE82_PLEWA|nr:hypothetical protein NDU88_002767 [Pleurodeles waltl]